MIPDADADLSSGDEGLTELLIATKKRRLNGKKLGVSRTNWSGTGAHVNLCATII